MSKKLRVDWYLPPGTGLAVFDDSTIERGLGGSEASVVYLTRIWAKMGHTVTVYNDVDVPTMGHGVMYKNTRYFAPYDSERDVFILHRTPMNHVDRGSVMADVKVFFSCDQATVGHWSDEVYPFVDKIISISEYHKQYMYLYANARKDNIYVTNLGVSVEDYKPIPKVKHKMIFCSVPERGLIQAIDFFRDVRAQVPDATLVVTADHRLWGASYTGVSDVLLSVAKGTEGLTYLGAIPRKELIHHQLESEIQFYPCIYDENFCISAAECQMAGAVPITTRIGALPTTVQDGVTGIVHNMPVHDPALHKLFVDSTVDLLNDDVRLATLRKAGIERAKKDFDWNVIANKWLDLFDTIRRNKQ